MEMTFFNLKNRFSSTLLVAILSFLLLITGVPPNKGMLMPQDTKPHSQNLVCSKSNAKKNNKIGKIDTIILDDITEDTPKECVGGLKSPYQRRKSTKKKMKKSISLRHVFSI